MDKAQIPISKKSSPALYLPSAINHFIKAVPCTSASSSPASDHTSKIIPAIAALNHHALMTEGPLDVSRNSSSLDDEEEVEDDEVEPCKTLPKFNNFAHNNSYNSAFLKPAVPLISSETKQLSRSEAGTSSTLVSQKKNDKAVATNGAAKRKKSLDPIDAQFIQLSSQISHSIQQNSDVQPTPRDENDHFGLFIAGELKTMQTEKRKDTIKKIIAILYD